MTEGLNLLDTLDANDGSASANANTVLAMLAGLDAATLKAVVDAMAQEKAAPRGEGDDGCAEPAADAAIDARGDVYSMFFLSDFCSQGFWFAIVVWVMKLSLVMIIAMDLYFGGAFPESADVPHLVKITQLLLLPVNVSVQEELKTTFFIYANLKWSKHIMVLNRGASRGKYHAANLMRFLVGLPLFFIYTTLLLQATQVLGIFLSFAALGFLSSIDNVALRMARDGYLTENLENTAKDVLIMKLPKNHNKSLQGRWLLLTVLFLVQLVVWILFQFVF